jgi:monoamine oxidase
MARTTLFDQFSRTIRVAWFAEENRISTGEALDRVAEARTEAQRLRSRREFLGDMGCVASGALASIAATPATVHTKQGGGGGAGASRSIAIVGAGMAGLACADRLKAAGLLPTVYEARSAVGGRVRSLPGVFPGRTIELGGEFIDYWHAVVLKYVRRFRLTRVDLFRAAEDVLYRIDGVTYPESVIIDALREVVLRMKEDVRAVTPNVSARNFDPAPNSADRRLDNTNLQEYLEQLGAADVLVKALQSVFGGEYGQEIDRQSCLNFILFAKLTRSRSRVAYFGANNAERYAIAEGNQAMAERLRDELVAAGGRVESGMSLVALRKATDGRYVLTFENGTTRTHEAVVLAIPATVVRARLTLDASLGIAPETRAAIAALQYGDNTKTMFQFASNHPFAAIGGDGTAYATDHALSNVQVTFPSKTAAPGADPTMPVIVDYGFGDRGRRLPIVDPDGLGFLTGYDAIFPGTVAVPLLNGELFARAHWPSDPNALGSYTCNQPGYFTTMEGWLGEPAGNLAFAGEHTDSFHNFQGFIEGAAESGIRAAEYLLGRVRNRLL